jgi:hypothetical protein
MRTDNLPQAIAAASRIPFSPDLRLGITTRCEAGSVAPGLSAPLAAQAAGGSSSSLVGHGARSASTGLAKAPSPGKGGVCARKSDRGVVPGHAPETGDEPSIGPGRTDQLLSCVGIVLVLACVLFDAPFWLGRAFVALGWA